jgi:hypothetical protein
MRRRGKYNARQVRMMGLKFASRAEAARYLVLADMAKRGEIRSLTLQQVYDLPANITYRADFSYLARTDAGWVNVVEDVKGFETASFRLKKRLFEDRYHMLLSVVRMRPKDVNVLLRAAGVA